MNTIDYRSIDENGLSFELLIDGWPFGELIGVPNASIPVWLFENDLPSYSSFDSPGQDDETRIIAVCGCGEYGCRRSLCRVVREVRMLCSATLRRLRLGRSLKVSIFICQL
jgi:hypothetical protein